ncbi:MAG TPA: SDR family NAD(P)-dependent oxidoreductase [Hyphomicrobiaceae bacterium]|jgi:short-subunit dehydrogenase|nr:SDR family NAD(P)-dependent oxidoreductase [Hyphomicrobiaceae bacterium]
MFAQAAAPKTVIITGASRGLGRALALAYAAPGRRLALLARNQDLLSYTARLCEMRGAQVLQKTCDVTDQAAMDAFVAAVEAEGPIDLAIANAGDFWGNGPNGALEPLARALGLIKVNLDGTIVTVNAVLTRMRARKQGQIALIACLAALHPLADAPAYSASKAGLAAYGAALREMLAPEGVTVSIVCPGHIDTDQTDVQIGPLPLLMLPDEAAQKITAGLARRRGLIVFPRRLAWLIRLGWLLPWQLRARLQRPLRFYVSNRP